MARPKADVAEMRARLLVAAEDIMRRDRSARLTVSDVAATVGMGQSNVYRYVRSRHHLVELLAERWFGSIEQGVVTAVSRAHSPGEKIAQWVIATMEQKTALHDRDPELFAAYLELAAGHGDIVSGHVERLRDLVTPAVEALVGKAASNAALNLLEDATAQFRVPQLIMLNRPRISIERAMPVIDAVLLAFAAPGGPQRTSA